MKSVDSCGWLDRFSVKTVALARLSAILLLAAGCGSSAPRTEFSLGGFVLQLTPESAALVVAGADGRVLLDAPAGGLRFRKAEASYEFSFGAFRITETTASDWQPVARFGPAALEDGQLDFDLLDALDRSMGTARVTSPAEGQLRLRFASADPGHNRASLSAACAADEHFQGFGGQSFDVDHRGQRVPLWVEEDGITKQPTDDYDPNAWFLIGRRHSTHTPMPLFVSSRGYGLLLDTPLRSIFSMGSEDPERIRIEAWEGRLDLRLFDGPDPASVLARLSAQLGRPPLPPAFAFAPWLDAMYGSANLRRVAAALRASGVASSVIWTEDWRGGERSGDDYVLDEDWECDRALYPDLEAVASDLHALGFKFLTYNNTFLDSETGTYAEAASLGHCIRDESGEPYLFTSAKFTPTSLVDLSSPEAVTWMKAKYRQGLELGADGYMADFAEWLPTDARLASGEDAVSRHNLYPVDFQRANRELLDEMYETDGVERLFFVRSAYLGSQPLVSVVWAGDQQTDFSPGDGLPSVIPIGIGLGMSGFPFYGHDIGGYMSALTEPTSRECWYRWVTLGALSPVMRTHHGRSAFANWSWESDPASTAHLSRWAGFHLRLFPYLYGLAEQARESGLPMMRPLSLVHPDFEPGWSATDVFMLGDRLYVAPVIEPGATSRRVLLPPGRYYPLLGGEPIEGGGIEVLEAPLENIPVLVAAGSVLVLLPEGTDSLVAAQDGALQTLADVGDDRTIWLWPGGESEQREQGGSLVYRWQADPAIWIDPHDATWNDTPVQVGEHGELALEGNGVFEATGMRLEVEGGRPTRRLELSFRWLDPSPPF
ncbi:MAG: hypothetical protein JXR96_25020 [Deltaproteobacteria bacterium]|nr:hypothetical protein [Deltaproteobacteria bacterium]